MMIVFHEDVSNDHKTRFSLKDKIFTRLRQLEEYMGVVYLLIEIKEKISYEMVL